MEAPLTPNTSAFLSYLAAASAPAPVQQPDPKPQMNNNPLTSLPPSAFFPMPLPGRDTPEGTPPRSNNPSASPELGPQFRSYSVSDSDEQAAGGGQRSNDAGQHKRKVAKGHMSLDGLEDEEDEFESDAGVPHEDKRHHQNGSAQGRKGRKSGGGEDGDGKGPKEKEMGKAARRKEQNRAAQKAFRERREAKVKDLEDKVKKLEETTYGYTVENENLRAILKRLQEENVALKQSAFTFSMPLAGSGITPPSGGAPTPAGMQFNRSPASAPVTANKPSVPHRDVSVNSQDDQLVSLSDVPSSHRSSEPSTANSPESLVSINSARHVDSQRPTEANFFTNVSLGLPRMHPFAIKPDGTDSSPSDRQTPPSSGADNRSEIDALWASFYPNGLANFPGQQTRQQILQQQLQHLQQQQSPLNAPSPFSQFMAQVQASNALAATTPAVANINVPGAQSNTDSAPSPVQQPAKSMAYRDTSTRQEGQVNWGALNQENMSNFLESLSGGPPEADNSMADDDFFNAQLRQVLQPGSGITPGIASGQGNGEWNFSAPIAFSPTNYLNMSPSPLETGSSSADSPTSGSISGPDDSKSSATTPESSPVPAEMVEPLIKNKIVRVIGEDGRDVKPSELWVRAGLHNVTPTDIVIDDLCDQMRAKATVKGGQHFLKVEDAETMLRWQAQIAAHDC
ncbi:hypothetical protein M231_02620 [Tremella mesenterica]|uniref:BZIP domain-containing protein n=1 Tax=Tremella mesenterica TaxID=5217 RepID=A0A4Q1BQR1_TREME|nr:hypothetical protein M231_02620 [Tremella mesenterica]